MECLLPKPFIHHRFGFWLGRSSISLSKFKHLLSLGSMPTGTNIENKVKEYEKLRRLKPRFGTPYFLRWRSFQRFSGTFSDRTNYIKMRCASDTENGSTMMMHRQPLVLQAPVATCSVDSSSHESFTESLSDRSTPSAFDYSKCAICAQNGDLTLRESQTNDSRSNAEGGINQPIPRRYEPWNLKRRPNEQPRGNEDAYGSELALFQSLQLCL